MKYWAKLKELRFYMIFFLTFLSVKVREFLFKKSTKPVARLAWFGAYGNTNIGDDLIFFSIKQYIPRNIEIRLSCRQKTSTTDYGVATFYRYDKEQIIREIRNADYVLLGGGGLFEYYQVLHKENVSRSIPLYLYVLLYARLYGKKYGIVGMGCNEQPFPNVILRTVFGDISRNADFVITRDKKSYNGFLANGGAPKNLFSNYDPVFSLPSFLNKKEEDKQRSRIVVGFLIWPFFLHPFFHANSNPAELRKVVSKDKLEKHELFCLELRKVFSMLQSLNIDLVFPLFHFSDKILLDELKCSYKDEITFGSYFSQLNECNVVVSMRYHGQITSIANNIPIVSIPVQEKMTALVQNFSLEPYCVDIENFKGEKCLKVIEDVLKNESIIRESLMVDFNKISGEVKSLYNDTVSRFLS